MFALDVTAVICLRDARMKSFFQCRQETGHSGGIVASISSNHMQRTKTLRKNRNGTVERGSGFQLSNRTPLSLRDSQRNSLEPPTQVVHDPYFLPASQMHQRTKTGRAEAKLKLVFKARKLRRVGCYAPPPLQPARHLKEFPKGNDSVKHIALALEKNILFNNYNQRQINMIISVMKPEKVEKGKVVIREGSVGHKLYVIHAGEVEVSRLLRQGGVETFMPLISVDLFGEIGLLYDSPTQATITCKTACQFWTIDRKAFKPIINQSIDLIQMRIKQGLRRSKIIGFFEKKTEQERAELIKVLADVGHYQSFKPGEQIIKRGAETTFFYIILSGTIVVNLSEPDQDIESEVDDVMLETGDYFGESSLMADRPQNANIYSETASELFVLDEEAFTKYLATSHTFLAELERNSQKKVTLSV